MSHTQDAHSNRNNILTNPKSLELAATGASDAREWAKKLAVYRHPSRSRSIIELTVTIAPFATLWAVMATAFIYGHFWLYALLILPAAGLLVRLFAIEHDCGHGAFFPSRFANDWTGRALGVITLTPYDGWQRSHAVHHAGSGDLDQRGIGDIDTLTVREYLARTAWGRLKYRLYRHPVVMFGIGPTYLFLVENRIPLRLKSSARRPWVNAMGTNLALIFALGIAIWAIGPLAVAATYLPVVILAATAGVWLFYVQHQFEGTSWDSHDEWGFHEAALHGSSHYVLPRLLQWFTANISIHHVHHLASRIPFYRLPQVLRDHPDLLKIGRLTVWQSFRNVPLCLWDEQTRRLVSIKSILN